MVCAADEDEIESLVASVVCQRHVWNIPIPVVGISLFKTGTTTIVIGWSEVETCQMIRTRALIWMQRTRPTKTSQREDEGRPTEDAGEGGGEPMDTGRAEVTKTRNKIHP